VHTDLRRAGAALEHVPEHGPTGCSIVEQPAGNPQGSRFVTTCTCDFGAALYSCSLYWILRTLMPRISAALDVEPAVASRVFKMA
jgi:hypothetical protein